MKKKILIISILTIILIIIISVIIYIQVQDKTNEVLATNSNISTEENNEETKDENTITDEENIENTEENNEEITNEEQNIETKDESTTTQVTQETKEISSKQTTTESTNEKTNVGTQKTNTETSVSNNTQQTQASTSNESENQGTTTKIIDLTKYDRYEEALNGGYKAYIKSDSEMNKLKGLIDACIQEFGYTNVKVIQSSSIVGSTQSFTANKTNVENKVYNSEGFTIYYYAEAEYHITADGTETIFQYRSYIKVQ